MTNLSVTVKKKLQEVHEGGWAKITRRVGRRRKREAKHYLNIFHILSHINIIKNYQIHILQYFFHFTNEKTKAHKGKLSCSEKRKLVDMFVWLLKFSCLVTECFCYLIFYWGITDINFKCTKKDLIFVYVLQNDHNNSS